MHSRSSWTLAIIVAAALLGEVTPASGQPTYARQDELALPVFQTETPRFCLLTFPSSDGTRETILIAVDGDRLYVDRNSDGDLTNDGPCAVSTREEWESERHHLFSIKEIQVGKKIHKRLRIRICPLEKFDRDDEKIKSILKAEPEADCYTLSGEIEDRRFQGDGNEGRITVVAGLQDLEGVLQFGNSLETAPTINLCGDLEIRLYSDTKLRPGAETDVTAVVGTPGIGPGTFALIGYEGVIPEFLHPRLTLRVNGEERGKTETTTYELSHRC